MQSIIWFSFQGMVKIEYYLFLFFFLLQWCTLFSPSLSLTFLAEKKLHAGFYLRDLLPKSGSTCNYCQVEKRNHLLMKTSLDGEFNSFSSNLPVFPSFFLWFSCWFGYPTATLTAFMPATASDCMRAAFIAKQ